MSVQGFLSVEVVSGIYHHRYGTFERMKSDESDQMMDVPSLRVLEKRAVGPQEGHLVEELRLRCRLVKKG